MHGVESFKKYLCNIYKEPAGLQSRVLARQATFQQETARLPSPVVSEGHIENENLTLNNQTCGVAARRRARVRFMPYLKFLHSSEDYASLL